MCHTCHLILEFCMLINKINNINTKLMDLEEVGRGCGDWMELAQDRKRWRALVSTVMNLRVP